ncbi:MAG: hypothetical protein IPH84_04115 [Bacteroidales bacterium]|nr:hypothetical protein [Bacteroidales bacterium]
MQSIIAWNLSPQLLEQEVKQLESSKMLLNTAERQIEKSSLKFFTQTIDLAYNIANTIDAFKKLDLIRWNNVERNYTELENAYEGSITLSNVTNRNLTFQISSDGITWESINFKGGEYKKMNFWLGQKSQNYGFIRK